MNNIPSLENLSKHELVKTIGALRQRERECIADLVLYLSELDRRKLYRESGCNSLYAFCREILNYSEGSSYRRVQAARVIQFMPEVYQKLKAGELSLCALAELKPVLKGPENQELISKAEGKSKKEVQELIAPYKAPERRKREKIKAKAVQSSTVSTPMFKQDKGFTSTVEVNYSLELQADNEFMELYARVKAIMPGYQSEMIEVLRRALQEYELRHSPKERQKRREHRRAKKLADAKPANQDNIQSKAHHIPQEIRDQVYIRDGGRCSYTSPCGKRCGCRAGLEVDHIKPKALGGNETLLNLRLLCKPHNLMMAERS
ncbi:MAG: HNH endonuclease, partial [Bdellovibrionales bacterium]|nr:HNH endonuclease [Bdellovibrionales bacterium]